MKCGHCGKNSGLQRENNNWVCDLCHKENKDIKQIINKKINNYSFKFIERFSRNTNIDRSEFLPIMRFIDEQMESKKFILLIAPTGIGKSHISANLALNFKSKIVTDFKHLQAQYTREFPWMSPMRGKKTFKCPQLDNIFDCSRGHCDDCEHRPDSSDFVITDKNTEDEKIFLSKDSKFYNGIVDENLKKLENIEDNLKTIDAQELLKDDKHLQIVNDELMRFYIEFDGHNYLVRPDEKIPNNSKLCREAGLPIKEKIELCPYYSQLNIGKMSTFPLYNYDMFLRHEKNESNNCLICNGIFSSKAELIKHGRECHPTEEIEKIIPNTKKILILDEAHELVNKIREAKTIRLSKNKLKELFSGFSDKDWDELKKHTDFDHVKLFQKLKTISYELEQKKKESDKHKRCFKYLESNEHIRWHRDQTNCTMHFNKIKKCFGCRKIIEQIKNGDFLDCTEHLNDIPKEKSKNKHSEMIRNKSLTSEFLNSLKEYIEIFSEIMQSLQNRLDDHYLYYNSPGNDEEIVLEPIDVTLLAKRLFAPYDNVIFLSSSIHPKYFKDLLGLADPDFKSMSFPNPIPKDNRRIICDYQGKKFFPNALDYDEGIKIIAQKIQEILKQYSDKKGLILVGSKKDRDNIIKEFQKPLKDRLTPNPLKDRLTPNQLNDMTNLEDLLNEHKKKENSVLIHYNAWDGIDLRYDDGRFCIIATGPFISRKSKYHEKMKQHPNFGNEWIKHEDAFRLIQGCGRCVRAHDDYAYTIILYKGVEPLILWLRDYTKNYPEFAWMTDSIEES